MRLGSGWRRRDVGGNIWFNETHQGNNEAIEEEEGEKEGEKEGEVGREGIQTAIQVDVLDMLSLTVIYRLPGRKVVCKHAERGITSTCICHTLSVMPWLHISN